MKIFAALLAIPLTACVSIPVIDTQETRFQTKVILSEFNSVASQYIAKPTFASLVSFPNGESPDLLSYVADGYGSSYNSYIGVTKNKLGFQVQRTTADAFNGALEKYLSWSETATANKDAFTKDIAEIEYGAGLVSDFKSYYKLTFHSGNEQNHYLLVKSCSFSELTKEICAGDTALEKHSVLELKNDINRFISGEIAQKDIASKYN
ncbi:hypothetical protein [Rheinheimera soli]|uniref:hypothetical protein n=1 Tax=Rheinheimera soli TaxID=443616 RepID=UPI001E535B16|nr:hypothetical protein [Rheinheimera soli]